MTPSNIIAKYKSATIPDLGVATVRDFCDSWDHLRPLASIAGDLKDVQRPWMIKAIVASVPIGGRICEIGAGEPFVAAFLAQCGYEVTIVDPYDGSGQGPVDYEAYSAAHPGIRFVRSNFGQSVPGLSDGYFDAIYSVSVLEHVPMDKVASVCEGVRRYGKPAVRSIHAIDHVLRGAGDAYHLQKLHRYGEQLGISSTSIDHVTARCELDVETYFLSAEGHNFWRGAMPYEAFPMRKVVSVHFNSALG